MLGWGMLIDISCFETFVVTENMGREKIQEIE
jgi:hypothetical protein